MLPMTGIERIVWQREKTGLGR